MRAPYLFSALCVALAFTACSSDDDFEFDDLSKSYAETMTIPTRADFVERIDGQAWRQISQGFIQADGSVKDNNNGNQAECVYVLNYGRGVLIRTYTFSEEPHISYFDYNYDEKSGSIDQFNVVNLSDNGSRMTAIAECWYYPDHADKMVHGYMQLELERLSYQEKEDLLESYKVDREQLELHNPTFEASNGAELFGTDISGITFRYKDPGFEVLALGMTQISESVFNKYIAGYGWKWDTAHQIEPDGTVNKKEYEFIKGLEAKSHYYIDNGTFQEFSTSYHHNNTPWYIEGVCGYDETCNRWYEIEDEKRVGGFQIIALSKDQKSFYVIKYNMQNSLSSSSYDFRFNLVKFTRMSDKELKEMRQKHHTNFWDLYDKDE